ncbi:hypothetical protein [Streptomyces xantholiticus]|uniref:Uncharacterized protein n=1 Tax=Streptomyces xantholiticus TaxID=68285 RepID=A0ABV1UZD8_9ACTN
MRSTSWSGTGICGVRGCGCRPGGCTTTESFNNPPAMRAEAPRQAAPACAPVREAPPPPPPGVERPVAEPTAPEPVAPRPAPRQQLAAPARVPKPVPVPTGPVPAALLADLRRHDPRLLLSQRDIARLSPAVDAWLERGIAPDAVRRTLTAALPAGQLHHPAGLLGHRLTELLPPPLPVAAPSAPRPDPFQTCDGCDLAFRAPEPGLCSGCTHEAAALTAA